MLIEKVYSENPENLSVGIVNIHPRAGLSKENGKTPWPDLITAATRAFGHPPVST